MTFCDECMSYVPVGQDTRTKSVSIHGKAIPVQYRAIICGRCGAEIFDEDQEMTIMKKARTVYRQKNKMLSASSICAYMEKNHLSPEQMAVLAGCAVGEILTAAKGTLLDTVADEKIKKAISA